MSKHPVPSPALALALALALASCSPAPGSARERLEVEGGPVRLAAELHVPRTPGAHPGVVLVPGAGPALRDDPWFLAHAERLAGAGFAVLAYDKRGSGASGGDAGASLRELARDARAALDALRADPRVDPARVGLVGVSQGGAVALLAAQAEGGPDFVAAISFSPFSPAEQVGVTLEHRLTRAGFTDVRRRRAGELGRLVLEACRSGVGLERARQTLEAEEHRDWLASAGIPLLCDPDFDFLAFRELPMDFDPLDALERCALPVFVAQGGEDDLVPGPLAARVLADRARGRELDLTMHVSARAGHGLRVRDGVRVDLEHGWLEEDWRWPEDYWSALEDWLRARTALD